MATSKRRDFKGTLKQISKLREEVYWTTASQKIVLSMRFEPFKQQIKAFFCNLPALDVNYIAHSTSYIARTKSYAR